MLLMTKNEKCQQMIKLISDFTINLSNHHLIIDIVPAYDVLCSDSEEMLDFFESLYKAQKLDSDGFNILIEKIRKDVSEMCKCRSQLYKVPVEDREYPISLIIDAMHSYSTIAWLFGFNDIYITEEFYEASSN